MANSSGGSPELRPPRKGRICGCPWVAIAVLIGLALLFFILSLTVFKAKSPVTTVNSISLADLDFSVDILKFRVYFNVSIDADITVKNPNIVGFKFSASDAFLRYKGNDVGQVPIPAGEIGALDASNLNLTLTLMADRILYESDFYSDIVSGVLRFQAFFGLSGKLRSLFSIDVVTYTTCDLEIHLSTRDIFNKTCHHQTQI